MAKILAFCPRKAASQWHFALFAMSYNCIDQSILMGIKAGLYFPWINPWIILRPLVRDFREWAAICDLSVRDALLKTSRAPGFATQDHAEARDSNAAQGNTQDMYAISANLSRKECQGCSEARRPSRPTPRIQCSGATESLTPSHGFSWQAGTPGDHDYNVQANKSYENLVLLGRKIALWIINNHLISSC